MIISEIPKSHVYAARAEIIKISKEIHLTMIMLLCGGCGVFIKSPQCIVYCGFNISIKCNFFKRVKKAKKRARDDYNECKASWGT